MNDSLTNRQRAEEAVRFLKSYGWPIALLLGALAVGIRFNSIGYYPRLGLGDMTAVFAGSFGYTFLTLLLATTACALPSATWIGFVGDHWKDEATDTGKPDRLCRLFRKFAPEPIGRGALHFYLKNFLAPVGAIVLAWPLWAMLHLPTRREALLGLILSILWLALFAYRSSEDWKGRALFLYADIWSALLATVLTLMAVLPIFAEIDVPASHDDDLERVRLIFLLFTAVGTFVVASLWRAVSRSTAAWRIFAGTFVIFSVILTITGGLDVGAKVMFRQLGFGGYHAELVVTAEVATDLRAAGAVVTCPPSAASRVSPYRCIYKTYILSALGEDLCVKDPKTGHQLIIGRSKVNALVRRQASKN